MTTTPRHVFMRLVDRWRNWHSGDTIMGTVLGARIAGWVFFLEGCVDNAIVEWWTFWPEAADRRHWLRAMVPGCVGIVGVSGSWRTHLWWWACS